jgi:3-(3-hydroxy-phenyl)propionate hydroxylase
VLHNTLAQVALSKSDDRGRALRDVVAQLLRMDEPRRSVVGMISGLDVHYDLGGSHPLVGRRIPDLDLQTDAGTRTVFSLLHDARPVLLNLGSGTSVQTARVRVFQARYDGPWVLPVIGDVDAPTAVLIRPDGYVAWAGELEDPGLAEAIELWFSSADLGG